MKKTVIPIILGFVAMACVMAMLVKGNLNLRNERDLAQANVKAYNDRMDEQSRVFQFTVGQLEYLNDSIIRELDSTRKELGIRDRKIQQMGKVREKIYITDTLVVKDTIFKEPDFVLDTCLGDKWYQDCLHMEYPSTLTSDICVNTDLNCFIHTSRETVDPPRKTWLGRLFQRKHTIINVTVVENNPYMDIKENRFVKIIGND